MAGLMVFPDGVADPGAAFGWSCALARGVADFARLEGEAFAGSYAEATQWLAGRSGSLSGLVVILVRGNGMEEWLASLPATCPGVPVAGGAAARSRGLDHGTTFPRGQDVALFALEGGRWEEATFTAHRPAGPWFHLAGEHPRRFRSTAETGDNLANLLAKVRREHGLAEDDWERVALVDRTGVVLHLHPEGDDIVSGAPIGLDREVAAAVLDLSALDEARKALGPGCLVFGCAGLAGLSECGLPWLEGEAFTALYGEIHTASGVPRFCNLTLSVLRRVDARP